MSTKYATATEAQKAGATVTHHDLRPTTDQRDIATRTECAENGHPANCFNPWMVVTFCLCGARWIAGNHTPEKPEPPVCGSYEPCLMHNYCRNCYHDKADHVGA